jgi:hypothetical protein
MKPQLVHILIKSFHTALATGGIFFPLERIFFPERVHMCKQQEGLLPIQEPLFKDWRFVYFTNIMRLVSVKFPAWMV